MNRVGKLRIEENRSSSFAPHVPFEWMQHSPQVSLVPTQNFLVRNKIIQSCSQRSLIPGKIKLNFVQQSLLHSGLILSRKNFSW